MTPPCTKTIVVEMSLEKRRQKVIQSLQRGASERGEPPRSALQGHPALMRNEARCNSTSQCNHVYECDEDEHEQGRNVINAARSSGRGRAHVGEAQQGVGDPERHLKGEDHSDCDPGNIICHFHCVTWVAAEADNGGEDGGEDEGGVEEQRRLERSEMREICLDQHIVGTVCIDIRSTGSSAGQGTRMGDSGVAHAIVRDAAEARIDVIVVKYVAYQYDGGQHCDGDGPGRGEASAAF